MDNPQPGKKREVKLHFPKDLSATYSNVAILSATRTEFVFDFAQMLPPDPRANVQARIVMSPQHTKLLLGLLQRNVERYESQHGTIEISMPPTLAEQLFKSVQQTDDDTPDE